jgi:nucleoid-associated protein YgaU
MSRFAVLVLCAGMLIGFAGCQRMIDKGSAASIEQAEKKVSAGDYAAAVNLYEAALDGTARTAEVHYRLALLFADKLKSPLDALHHFDRYVALAPTGAHVKEAKGFREEAVQKLLNEWTGGSPFTQQDAVKLKNQNLELMKQLADCRAAKAAALASQIPPGGKKGEQVQKPIPSGARTHVVEPHETLASIAQKYYKSKARWKEIQDANFYPMEGTATLKPGMTLVIP